MQCVFFFKLAYKNKGAYIHLLKIQNETDFLKVC